MPQKYSLFLKHVFKKIMFYNILFTHETSLVTYFTDNQKHSRHHKDDYFSKYLSVTVPDWSRTT